MSQAFGLTIGLLVVGVFGDEEVRTYNDPVHDVVIVGDMVLSHDLFDYFYSDDDSFQRHATTDPDMMWPGGVVRYAFNSDINNQTRKEVWDSMATIMIVSCIRFQEDNSNQRSKFTKLIIENGTSCNSNLGYDQLFNSFISINNHCRTGNIMHDLFHILGFHHMQSSTNRDKFVKIEYNNIVPKYLNAFKQVRNDFSMYGTPYDYDSITHYPRHAYAIDMKKSTIIPKIKAPNMGQRLKLSKGDIMRLNRMYKCKTSRG